MKYILVSLLILTGSISFAQELNMRVTVLTPTIQTSDKRIFQTLQQSIQEFMNQTKWTTDKFEQFERIECSMQITINKKVSNDEYEAKVQVQASRPVFKTSYNSTLLNVQDDYFNFRYLEFQPIEFAETGTNTNLANMLAYYAYIILGMDYDSYSLLGGTPYFQKAQNLVAAAQATGDKGWKAFEGTRNRYWLSENILNPIFRPIRQLWYDYHRRGLDLMTQKKDDSVRFMAESIDGLKRVHREKPLSYLMQVLFYAKGDEFVNLFSGAYPDIKARVVATFNEVDPANSAKYEQITGRN
jgi:hypothetical protein